VNDPVTEVGAESADADQLRSVNRALATENTSLRSQIDFLRRQSLELDALRTTVAAISVAKKQIESQLEELHTNSKEMAQEQDALRARLRELECEATQYSGLYVDAEQQNTSLTSLYVASHHLHSSVRRQDVLARVQEIIINLIGSEELAIFECRGEGILELAASFGIDDDACRTVYTATGEIGRAATTGELFVASKDRPPTLPAERHLTACIPLKVGEQVTGAIAIFRLLKQKQGLVSTDYDLFDLLSTHAAIALYTATLHESTARMTM
jgi:regulator of replication initiation timing